MTNMLPLLAVVVMVAFVYLSLAATLDATEKRITAHLARLERRIVDLERRIHAVERRVSSRS